MMGWFRSTREWWGAKRRGEVRISAGRGRIYAKKPTAGQGAASEPLASLSVRVQRAGSDEWEDIPRKGDR